jgi:hypothetical protein
MICFFRLGLKSGFIHLVRVGLSHMAGKKWFRAEFAEEEEIAEKL